MTDQEYSDYRKKLLSYFEEDESYNIHEWEDDVIKTIFRDKNGILRVRRRMSIGYSKRFINGIRNRKW